MCSTISALLLSIVLSCQAKDDPDQSAASQSRLKALAVQVQSGLIADRILGGQPIEAKVDGDVVALEGTVPTEEYRDRVSKVAEREAGKLSTLVANRVRVKAVEIESKTKTTADPARQAKPTELDKEQLDQLRALIKESMPEAAKRINLVFRLAPMPTIVVEGVMETYDQKLALNKLIRENYQGLAILNNIRVHVKPEAPAAAAVTPAPSGAPKTIANTAITVDKDTPPQDRKLAEKVASALRQDKQIQDAAIVVQADYDVIWLRGSVQSQAQRVRAVNRTYTVEGVGYVIDDLSVDPKPKQDAKDDLLESAEVVNYVRNYFSRRVANVNIIDVKVVDEKIIVQVKDTFVDPQERQAADQAAAELKKELGRNIELRVEKPRR